MRLLCIYTAEVISILKWSFSYVLEKFTTILGEGSNILPREISPEKKEHPQQKFLILGRQLPTFLRVSL